ncbi:hypothetical protein V5799_020863 [Amblyomma americanum]|uniref:Uncharacterized protein n=1 Tax=Amblyomma americanum TaxID=6943 RepID=A0AAQ4ET71_AMBAM
MRRAYEMQNEGALPLFAGGAVTLFILLVLVFYFVWSSDEYLSNFLQLKRTGLTLLVSVLVPDVSKASADPGHFAAAVVGWAAEQRFDGVELDLDQDTDGRGYDALVQNNSLGEVYTRTGTLSRLVPVLPFMSREFELQPFRGAPKVAAGIACRGLAPATQYHSTPGTRAFFEVCQTLEDSSWFKAWQEDEYLYMMARQLRFIVAESKESVICKARGI